MAKIKDAASTNATVTLLPRHVDYLRRIKKEQAQTASDTVRRALDEYMKANPLPEVEK